VDYLSPGTGGAEVEIDARVRRPPLLPPESPPPAAYHLSV